EDPVINGVNPKSILSPHIILFDETQPDYARMVLDEFGKLIIDNDLHQDKKSKFVAIGRVGKDKGDDKITLNTYLSEFEKDSFRAKETYPTLIEYLHKELTHKKFNYSERIINSILHLLELHDFKNEVESRSRLVYRRFTKTTLFDFLQKENEDLYVEFKTFISDCGLIIKTDESFSQTIVHEKVIEFVKCKLLPLKSIEYKIFKDFIKKSDETSAKGTKLKESNTYTYNDTIGNSIPIKINTIHGEKGETHTATLYLETYKHGRYDSNLIMKQLAGSSINSSSNQTACKMAYVAMSRPEKLLCFAVSSSRISEEYYNEKMKPLGWEIRNVNSTVSPAVI
ncbi:MAG: hypothetical protein VB048_05860, partial [Bacteroidaceae bacterium]|nr:hypothetical protein [Bacteroidaceae bacterium]